MRTIVSSIILVFFTTLALGQQEVQKKQRNSLTADQVAELQTKKMTLALELSDAQQAQKKLNVEQLK